MRPHITLAMFLKIFHAKETLVTIRNVIIILAFFALSMPGAPCLGDEIVILGNHYKPPKVYLENNDPKGILVDIMRHVEKRTGHSFNIQLYPWKRAYREALKGEGGIFGLSMTTERRLRIFDYSDIMYYDDIMLVVLKGNEFPFNSIEDLKGKRVGARRGAIYGDEFKRGKNELFAVDEDGYTAHRLKKLLRGHIDVALIGPGKTGFNRVMRDNFEYLGKKDAFVVLPKPFIRDPQYLGFAKSMNMKGFLQEFNQVLKKMFEDGTIQRIFDKYSEKE